MKKELSFKTVWGELSNDMAKASPSEKVVVLVDNFDMPIVDTFDNKELNKDIYGTIYDICRVVY